MIKVVVFDLDDTLFPEYEFVLSGFRAVSSWIDNNHSVKGFYQVAEEYFRHGSSGNIFDLSLGKIGIPISKKLIADMVKVYREHMPAINLFADARWAVEYYGARSKLGVITDGFLLTQKNKIHALGIEDSFNLIVYTDEFGKEHWKPSETSYKKVMSFFSCRGNECVYIGDNPAKDFVTARSLGWLTVQIRRPSGVYIHQVPEKGYHADNEISSLYELKGVI